jgi:pimeloyl-ACP methyl ester carboxylesterase
MPPFDGLQDRLLYFPSRHEQAVVEQVARKSGMSAWPAVESYRGFVANAKGDEARGVLAIFHGNAGTAAERRRYVRFLSSQAPRIVLLEYPGYGARTGKPSEAGLIEDGAESLRLMLQQYGRPLYVLGESLGAAVAAGAVARAGLPVDGLILCTPWDDLTTLAQALYWFLPVRALIRDAYDSVGYLRAYRGPLAVIAAERDEIVPRKSSLHLYAAYQGPKMLWTLPGGHNAWLEATDARGWAGVFEFLRTHSKPGNPP